jgi:hypothetical protein
MAKEGWNFWDIVALTGAVLILFWATLKSLGVLHSPAWIEMIPFFGIGITFLGFILGLAYKFGGIINKIESTNFKVGKLADQFSQFEQRFNRIEHEHNLAVNGKLKFKH